MTDLADAHNDNDRRTAAQKADPAWWRKGDALMLDCEARDGHGDPHPEAGRIGVIRDIGTARGPDDKVMVEIETDDEEGRDTLLLLPLRMFLPVPAFCVEAWHPRPRRSAWRLSAEGRRTFDAMQWPRTVGTTGGPV